MLNCVGRRKAEDFIDKLIDLNQKRRGISSSKNNRQKNASLNLSGAQSRILSPKYGNFS